MGRAVTAEVLGELRLEWPDLVADDETSLPRALSRIEEHKGSGFVFVIDEWDCVMREAAEDAESQRAYLDY